MAEHDGVQSPPVAPTPDMSSSEQSSVVSAGSSRRRTNYSANLYFRDGLLFVPGFQFQKAKRWDDVGSTTLLTQGVNLKDGSNVLAKIVPTHTAGALCLDRELNILRLFGVDAEAVGKVLRVIDYFSIPKANGDVVVLLLTHPGENILSSYFPPSRVNAVLFPVKRDEGEAWDEEATTTAIELVTFLEFAVQATQCLEVVHSKGIIHREIRLNAFHFSPAGRVRLVHFGNRSTSLESLGGPSGLVLQSEDRDWSKVKEAIAYLPPEQINNSATIVDREDHRTDLYALGVTLWILLTGHGTLPFEGSVREFVSVVRMQRPLRVHEVRRDVPKVISDIIDKLMSKDPEDRYSSAIGLKHDLLQCQKWLNIVPLSTNALSSELIPNFELGRQDKYLEFTLPHALFGREKEVDSIHAVIRRAISDGGGSESGAPRHAPSSASVSSTIIATPVNGVEDEEGSFSGRSESTQSLPHGPSNVLSSGTGSNSMKTAHETPTNDIDTPPIPPLITPLPTPALSRSALVKPTYKKVRLIGRPFAVVVQGPGGMGKSSLVMEAMPAWRLEGGLWGSGKCSHTDSQPYAPVFSCLSSVLQQLSSVYSDETTAFIDRLRARLGSTLPNIQLLFEAAPELRGILALHDITSFVEIHSSNTVELRARFIDLMVDVFTTCAELKHLALFFDDLHNANESTLEVISALASSKLRMLFFGTVRTESETKLERIRKVFNKGVRTTWLDLRPLTVDAMGAFVSQALRVPPDTCSNISRLVHRISRGSPFAARNLLTTLRRQNYIFFDWEGNHWRYNIELIESKFISEHFSSSDPGDVDFLVYRLQEFPEPLQKYVVWGCFFGPAFKITDVAMMMDWEDGSGSSEDSDGDEPLARGKGSMTGLQLALAEGWLVHRGRETCAFSHDRFRQAAVAFAEKMSPDEIMRMNLRIAVVLLQNGGHDASFRVADFAKRCLPLLPQHPRRKEFFAVFLRVGQQASVQGAHELALQYCECARQLLADDAWSTESQPTTLALLLKTAELLTWSGDHWASDQVLDEILQHVNDPVEHGHVSRLQARNCWARNDFKGGLARTLNGLRVLGVDIDLKVTEEEIQALFDKVKLEIITIGFDNILKLPHSTDPKVEVTVLLLNDASINAHWSEGKGLADLVGLKNIQMGLRHGISSGTPGGFLWALSVAAESKGLYRAALDMGRMAMDMAEAHSSVADRGKYEIMYMSVVSGYDPEHLRCNIQRSDSALRLSRAAGDRMYAAFGVMFNIQTQLYICRHLSELVVAAEEGYMDITTWIGGNNTEILAMSIMLCIRALGGYTISSCADDVFDSEEFVESHYLKTVVSKSANVPFVSNWYNAYKVVALFCLGWTTRAAELGFQVYETRIWHPNHRHVRYGLTYHSLALIQCLRDNKLSLPQRARYLEQVELNQAYVKKWADIAPTNTMHWVTLVEAELASLSQGAEALQLYDIAIRAAANNDWILEEGWAVYLAGCHFIRCGMPSFGNEMQRRGIARQSHWGALGIVNSLERVTERSETSVKRSLTAEVGTQTDRVELPAPSTYLNTRTLASKDGDIGEQDLSHLSAEQFASIIKWTQSISSDINISSSLEKLTDHIAKSSGADKILVIIRHEAGDYSIATSMNHPDPIQVFDIPLPISEIKDILTLQVVQQVIHSKEPAYQRDASEDPRYSAAAELSSDRSILCFPIYNQGVDVNGCIYLASNRPHAFSPSTITMLGVLAQQASISITNALLFRSVQNTTRANIRMISAQKEALENARKSREDALRAAKTKSNFLASMSHELRTPFSSFYGLLDLLNGTSLDWEQRELVQTARQSCELLLEIIDGLLDYSKLEAAAVKLESIPVYVEDLFANAVELLTHLSVKRGLDLSFHIEPDVPFCILGDSSRLQQVLMNLLGNALKFTESGSVKTICSVDRSGEISCEDNQVVLKCVVIDTGIGMTPADMKGLWQPFSQVDQSTTRKFGGTGLGLSICLSLVKLMHGDVGVNSRPGVGSRFWFRIPVTVHTSVEVTKAQAVLDDYRQSLISPTPARIVLSSPMDTTRDMLTAALKGIDAVSLCSTTEAEVHIRDAGASGRAVNFIVIDEQSEARIDDVAKLLKEYECFGHTRVIHLCAPSADFMNRRPAVPRGQIKPDMAADVASQGGLIVRLTKPPRMARFLRLLSLLWANRDAVAPPPGPAEAESPSRPNVRFAAYEPGQTRSRASEAVGDSTSPYAGNVLIAEDNPVAQNLLIRQLKRYGLSVTATSNGEEALNAWDQRPPGYFTAALFDHHMPVCDGVEATKRLRGLEKKRKIQIPLPIYALSADCQDSTKLLCLSAGMTHFLTKPLRQGDLLGILKLFEVDPSDSQ